MVKGKACDGPVYINKGILQTPARCHDACKDYDVFVVQVDNGDCFCMDETKKKCSSYRAHSNVDFDTYRSTRRKCLVPLLTYINHMRSK